MGPGGHVVVGDPRPEVRLKALRQAVGQVAVRAGHALARRAARRCSRFMGMGMGCLLYTSDAADEEDSVDLGGHRNIKKKKNINREKCRLDAYTQHTGNYTNQKIPTKRIEKI